MDDVFTLVKKKIVKHVSNNLEEVLIAKVFVKHLVLNVKMRNVNTNVIFVKDAITIPGIAIQSRLSHANSAL